jgi:hypothetical protein
VLLEDLLDVLGRRLVLEPDLVDKRALRPCDGLWIDVGNAVRRLERPAERQRADSASPRKKTISTRETTTARTQAPSVSPGRRAAAVARRSVIDSVT